MGLLGGVYNFLIGGDQAPDVHDQLYTPQGQASLMQAAQMQAAQYNNGQSATFDPSQANGSRGYLASLADQLGDQAAGRGPSLAQMQFNQGMDANLRQQSAMMAAQRGNPLAGYLAAQNASLGAQNLAGQAAMGRLAEQRQAQGMLGQIGESLRGQDLQQAQLAAQNSQFNAGQANQIGLANAQLLQGANSQNAQYQQAAAAQNAQQQQAWNAMVQQMMEQQQMARNAYKYNYALGNQQGQQAFGTQLVGGLMSGIGSAGQSASMGSAGGAAGGAGGAAGGGAAAAAAV